jgi:hypothetical protein
MVFCTCAFAQRTRTSKDAAQEREIRAQDTFKDAFTHTGREK